MADRYRPRATVEAIRFDGSNGPEIQRWAHAIITTRYVVHVPLMQGPDAGYLVVMSRHGTQIAYPGAWVVVEQGRLSVFLDEEFSVTYEAA